LHSKKKFQHNFVSRFLRLVKNEEEEDRSHFYIHERAKHKIERNFIENKVRNAKSIFFLSGTQILVTKKKNGNRTETSQQLGKPFIGIADIKVCLEQLSLIIQSPDVFFDKRHFDFCTFRHTFRTTDFLEMSSYRNVAEKSCSRLNVTK
jgi:hypothetical protein